MCEKRKRKNGAENWLGYCPAMSQYSYCIMTWWAGRLLGLVMCVSQYNHHIVTGAAVARELYCNTKFLGFRCIAT